MKALFLICSAISLVTSEFLDDGYNSVNVSYPIASDYPTMFPFVRSDIDSNAERKVLKILASQSYSGFQIGPIATEASLLALNQLRKMPNWLPNYELVLEQFDDAV